MTTKHEKEVLSKLVNDPSFIMKDAQYALDMSRMGTINKMKNVAFDVLRDNKWKV